MMLVGQFVSVSNNQSTISPIGHPKHSLLNILTPSGHFCLISVHFIGLFVILRWAICLTGHFVGLGQNKYSGF